jgi:hypothetical protein
MPYASAGVRELWFGASSAAAVPGCVEARPRAGGAAALRRAAVPVSRRSCAPMAGDVRGPRAAAGALHVTVAGDAQHGSTQRDASLRRLTPAA